MDLQSLNFQHRMQFGLKVVLLNFADVIVSSALLVI